MKKLTSSLCKDFIGNLKSAKAYRGISLSEEIYLQALEIALPVLEQQESTTDTHRQIENDGWIEWRGGERPVDILVMVQTKLRSGKVMPSEVACYWGWQHNQSINDIIAYRVIENDGGDS